MPFFDPIRIGASGAADSAFTVDRSVRYDRTNNSYFSKQPSSAGNRRTFTISTWVKRSNTGVHGALFYAGTSVGANHDDTDSFRFNPSDQLIFEGEESQTVKYQITTNRKFRDPSAWYHIVLAVDTTQATSSNRIKFYVNGVQETDLATTTYPSQNYELFVNSTVSGGYTSGNIHVLGYTGSGRGLDGYLAEYHLIDGQQLTPASFAETNATTGQWIPIDTSGLTYGTNGFRLQFLDNSGTTATTLGKDTSGNSNNYTPNNFSVAAGENNDSVEDTPTNNWCTLNPLDADANGTFSEGNLKCVGSTGFMAGSNFVVTSGKWYMEVKYVSGTSNHQWSIGFSSPDRSYKRQVRGGDGELTPNTGTVAVTFADPDVIMLALDVDNGKWYIGKNGSYMLSGDPVNGTGFVHSGLSSSEGFMLCMINNTSAGTQTIAANFGQQGFTYTPPTDFKALNSANLPDPTILLPNNHFNTVLYTGNSSNGHAITGVGFQPDWTWIKARTDVRTHSLIDAVRGAGKILSSNNTNAEYTDATAFASFDSDGFTVGTSENYINNSSHTYVGWNWNAGGSTASNSDGSITSSVRANTSAGFSIVSYTGTGSNATIGHGLGVAPSVIIIKARDRSDNWWVYHKGLSDPSTKAIQLNNTNAEFTPSTSAFNPSAFTSSVFGVLTDGSSNASGEKYIAYCFNEVSSYSKFASYTGNGNADGTFVFTGFRVSWLMVKRSSASSASSGWFIFDNKRNTFNQVSNKLVADSTQEENDPSTIGSSGANDVDFLSNGFKTRATNAGTNVSGDTYIFLAFAESPFKNARAR